MRKQNQHSNTKPLSKAEYIKHCGALAQQYENDVLSHAVITNEFIKLAVQRGVEDKKRTDIEFDQLAVDRVYEFFSFINIKVGKRYKQFPLLPYQCWILRELFGYFLEDGTRRFMFALLFVSRKNGKTVFAEAISFYMYMYDGETDAEVYYGATGPEQTRQLWEYAKNIINNSPVLKKRIRQYQYHMVSKVNGNCILKYVISDPKKLDSLGPSFALVDEYHAHKDDGMFNIFVTGMVNRENPMLMITSTAGVDKDGPLFEDIETAKKVLRGDVINDRYFYALYTLDNEREIEQPEMWIKANPSLGTAALGESRLRTMADAAKLSPTKWHNFVIKNLNVFQDALIDQWIPDSIYRDNFTNPNLMELRGEFVEGEGRKKLDAFIGIDMASTRDLASMVCVVENPKTKKLEVFSEFYFPQNEQKRIRGGSIDLRDWIKKGYIFECDQPTIDDQFIADRLEKFAKVFNVYYLGYDKFNANYLITKAGLLGINSIACPQTALFFNQPLKYIEKLMYLQRINMSKNPVMRWNFNNVVLYMDGNGNIKIMKNKSNDSVDGAVSLGMAVGCYLQANEGAELMEMYLKTG